MLVLRVPKKKEIGEVVVEEEKRPGVFATFGVAELATSAVGEAKGVVREGRREEDPADVGEERSTADNVNEGRREFGEDLTEGGFRS